MGRETVLPARPEQPLRAAAGVVRDLLEMAKGGITVFVAFTAAMGLWLAPAGLGLTRSVLFLLSTAVLVGAANMLNCWIEREADGLMRRTCNRPLPAGRLDPMSTLALAIVLAAVALPALLLVTNRLTALLGFAALATYVLVYTPLKRVSPRALEIGAVPGAIPPLMGWAAATGDLGAPAWALFGILFFWQLPHFIAIALVLEDDYERGGMQVLPVARGEVVARRMMLVYTFLLVAASLAPAALGITGAAYLVTASVLGAGFVAASRAALGERGGTVRARRAFFYSLIYLPILLSVLVLNAR
jgi:protoheme IX farnesyltransferase